MPEGPVNAKGTLQENRDVTYPYNNAVSTGFEAMQFVPYLPSWYTLTNSISGGVRAVPLTPVLSED